ncbi:MAG: hypothetical protein PF572_01535 [Patescibacteria group bacterium]|jgi:hypothetical protein|nr:hypothetical protein [Patescibacteria group bacterium]
MLKLNNKIYRVWMFLVGLIATIAYRIIVILNYYNDVWVEIAWYVGTIGFIWYFAHRYRVENKRDKLVENLKLASKIQNKKELSDEDRDALVYILRGLKTSLAKWNYIFIFVISFLALVYALYLRLS